MNISQLIRLRLASQQLADKKLSTVKDLVAYMGALQAQDFAMSKWAIGIRMKDVKQHTVEAAVNAGKIIRTHVLRPTWHFVDAEDIYWLLQLTASNIKKIMRSHDKQLGLDEKIYSKTNKIIEKMLVSKKHITREEIVLQLQKKFDVFENRSMHYLLRAELDGIICSGKIINNKHTYALLSETVKKKKQFNREESLHTLATKYFQSHGPATLQDFTWWSGLTITDATNAIHTLDRCFVKESLNNKTYWLKQDTKPVNKSTAFTLPPYDEYLISYKDRSAMIIKESYKKIISSNGIFFPVVLINGKVAGKWNRKIVQNKVEVNPDMFTASSPALNNKINNCFKEYAAFIDKELIL